jgi:hypothetical protein
MKGAITLLGLFVLSSPPAWAGKKAPPSLPQEFAHPTGAFTFKTPESWTLKTPGPETMEAWGQGMGVRFLFRNEESGFDSLHVTCMLERLAEPMQTEPRVLYEYDFVEGLLGERRVLDSAFAVSYDRPVRGHRQWRQRNVTVVGAGQSLCLVAYAPLDVWKKSSQARDLLNAVLASVTFH